MMKMHEKMLRLLGHWKKMEQSPMLVLAADGTICYHSENMRAISGKELIEWLRGQGSLEHRIRVVEDSFAYGVCEDEAGYIYLMGPISIYEFDLWRKKGLEHSPVKWYEGLENHIYRGNIVRLKSEMILWNYCISGQLIEDDDLFSKEEPWNLEENVQKYQFESVDNEQIRNSYAEVAILLDALRRGDIDEYFRLYDDTLQNRIGKMASNNYKQHEYLAVKIFSLYMHAIIDGGVDYNEAYDLSDLYLQRLEKCKNILQIQALWKEYIKKCIELVLEKKEKQREGGIVEEAKIYIQRHRNTKLSVGAVAKKINVNASYLSRTFSEREKMTVQQFIMREKVKASCNMLTYSKYSITEIAHYLCFSSDSHFCNVFKKVMGITPAQYRREKYSFIKEGFKQKNEG